MVVIVRRCARAVICAAVSYCVVASRRAASFEPQLSKSYLALLLATAIDLYGSVQLSAVLGLGIPSVLQPASFE
jgi:hypothetical protein